MERYAEPGYVWVCPACGKVSPHDRFGDKDSTRGWDTSCVINSFLVKEEDILEWSDDRKYVVKIKKVGNN